MFLSLLLAYLLSNFFRTFLAVIASDLSRDLALDAAQLATFQAAFLIAFAVTQLPVGLSLDRIGPRRTLIAGLCSAIAGITLLSSAANSWQGIIAMTFIGAGFSPVLMTGFYVIARSYPTEKFATISSLLYGLGALGDPLSGAPLTLAVLTFGWRATMLAMAGATAASLACVIMMVRDPPKVVVAGQAISALAAAKQLVMIGGLWLIVPLALVSYAVVGATRGLWIAPYLSQIHHFNAYEVGLSATGMGFATAAGGLLYAPINRLFGDAKFTAAAGVSLTVVAWMTLGLLGVNSATLAICLFLTIGCFGASFAIVLAHARSFMPTSLLGLGVTAINLVFFVGAGLTQWLSGRYVSARELASTPPADIYNNLFLGFGLALFIALAIYLLTPREKRSITH